MDKSEQIDLPALPEQVELKGLQSAASAPVPVDHEIDISFFSHKSRKSTRLIGNTSQNEAIRARREWLSFDFNEPIYVTSIKISAIGYEEYHEMEISLIDGITGEELKEKRKFGGSFFSFEPKRFVSGFGLRPDQSWSFTKSQYISRIDVRGLEQRNFFEVLAIYENISKEREKIEENLTRYFDKAKKVESEFEVKSEQLLALEGDFDAKIEEISSLNSQISSLINNRDELTKRIEIGSSVEKERNERVQSIEIDIQNLNNQRKDISNKISGLESQLRNIKNNINLFPTEIAGYVSQGTRNIRLYFWISLIPMAIIAFVTYRLFSNAERLLNFDLSGSTAGIFRYLLSRSPYVFVSATVLGICYSLVRGLVAEIVNINRRRQELFKISIIATDVSYASQDGMDLDDEQRYELRTQTKMEMLKEHLKMNLGDDFAYSPGQDYLRRLGSAVSKHKEGKPADQEQSAEHVGDVS